MATRRFQWGQVLGASLAVAVLLFAPMASAQEDASLEDEARSLFEAGRTAFEASRYESALAYFERAFELSQRPAMLFNLGATLERLQRNAEALDHYRRYLEELPDASNRAACERRIAFLDEQLSPPEPEPEPQSSAGAAPVASPDEGGGGDPAPWIVLGVSAAVAAGGVVLLVLSQVEAASVQGSSMGSRWSDYEAAAGRADAFGVAGWIALGVGVAGAAAAIVWGIMGSDDTEVAVGPGGVELRGSF